MPTFSEQTLKTYQIGGYSFGSTIYGGSSLYTVESYVNDQDVPRASQAGFGQFGSRVYGRSYLFPARAIPTTDGPNVAIITITAANGAFLGRIRSDIRRTLVNTLKFTLDDLGCGDFTLVLNDLPKFPLLPLSSISVVLSGDTEPVYCGYIENFPEPGTKRSTYTFTGFGFRKQLDTLNIPDDSTAIYASGTAAGEIVRDIAENIIAPNTQIRYNPSKISISLGTPIANDLDFNAQKITDIMDSMARIAGAEWGVDADKDLYFRDRAYTTPDRVYFIGIDSGEFKPQKVIEGVVFNSVFVKRKEGRGSGSAGYLIAGIFNNGPSQAKYGVRELEYSVPGFFADDEINTIGEKILDDVKDPKTSATFDDVLIRSASDVMSQGFARFIMPVDDYNIPIEEDSTSDDWFKTGVGNLVLSNSTDFVMDAAYSLALNWSILPNTITLSSNVRGRVKKVRLYVRSNRTGLLLRFGFGASIWSQYQYDLNFDTANQFFVIELDTLDLNLRKIGQIGFQTLNADSSTVVYIDKVETLVRTQIHYDLNFKRAEYELSTARQAANMEFGQIEPKNSDYIAQLIQNVETARAGNLIR